MMITLTGGLVEKDTLIALFGTDNSKEIFAKKETGKQNRTFSPRKPKRVTVAIEECRKLCAAVGLDYLSGYEGRVVEHVITDETVDRYGDIIRAKGVDYKTNYKKNPTIQNAHDYKSPPIGKSIKIWYDKEESNVKSWGLYYDDRIDKTGISDVIFKFIVAGAMPACSVGFVPLETSRPTSKEEREEIGLGDYGVEYLKIDLLEYSPCSIGANPNTLQNTIVDSIRKGVFTKDNCRAIAENKFVPDDFFDEFIKEVQKKYKDFTCTIQLGNNAEFDIEIPDEKEFEPEMKPLPNEHSCRLHPPDRYETCRSSSRKSDGKVYRIITCKIKGKDKWEEQAFRYPKTSWTVAQARAHCKKHGGISFEPAGKDVEILSEEKDVETKILAVMEKLIKELNSLGTKVENLNITFQPLMPKSKGHDNSGDPLDDDTKKLFDDTLGEGINI